MIVSAARAMSVAMVMPVVMRVTVVVMSMIVGFVGVAVMIIAVVVMSMIVPVMVMAVVVIAVIVPAGAVIVGRALGAERPRDRARQAPLAPHQLGRGGGRRDVECVRGDLGGHVAAAELPGEPHQPGGILGAYLEQVLRGGPHRHEAAVVEAQGIAVVEVRGLGEGHREMEPALGDDGLR
jgi:hypothetical protein